MIFQTEVTVAASLKKLRLSRLGADARLRELSGLADLNVADDQIYRAMELRGRMRGLEQRVRDLETGK